MNAAHDDARFGRLTPARSAAARPGPIGAGEILVADVGRVPDDGIVGAELVVQEKVPDADGRGYPRVAQAALGAAGRAGVQLDAGQPAGVARAGLVQEHRLAAGRFQDVVAGGADRPVEQEAGHRRRGEERTARLALRRVVTGCHAHHRAGTHRQPGVDPPVTARG
ncbi:hypothetical protein [Mycolicibacterium insubricum]|uniref:hypothetical protein n=1 Tax=Mycolicibacterium insubricum TaxID=444597 RepID=UPI0021F27838|nr:hypothetical protein [Mycolicibacterium insubricum]